MAAYKGCGCRIDYNGYCSQCEAEKIKKRNKKAKIPILIKDNEYSKNKRKRLR
jgi:hypothetical protein